jgi:hypothetical protein
MPSLPNLAANTPDKLIHLALTVHPGQLPQEQSPRCSAQTSALASMNAALVALEAGMCVQCPAQYIPRGA